MAEDPLDALMSATLAIEGEEAQTKRPALPFAGHPGAAPPAAPLEVARVDSGTYSEGNPWPPQQLPPTVADAPRRPAPIPAPAAWAAPAPPPPAPVRVGAPVYAPAGAMPSAMPEMISRMVASHQPQHVAPPPRISDAALARGATASAYAASNAATEARPAGAAADREIAVQASARAASSPQVCGERIDYLWHDKLAEEDILRASSMKKEGQRADPDDEWLSADHVAASASKEASGVRAILGQRQPRSIDEVQELYDKALDAGAERLYCLVRGEVTLSFESIEALRVTLSVITPFLGDARLKEAYEAAQEALRTSGGVAPAVAASHKERVDEALRAASRGASATIEAVIDRALIESRSFSRRRVFGAQLVRGLLQPSARGSSGSAASHVPVYLPDAAAEELPLMRSVPMRLIVEVRPAQDAVEAHPLALRVVAVARVVELGARRR